MNEKVRRFKGLILDGDGVIFSSVERRGVLDESGDKVLVMKSRDHHDGQGLSFLRAIGIKVLFATAEGEPMGSLVKKLNGLPSVVAGDWAPVSALTNLKAKHISKVEAIEEGWLKPQGLTWSECAYIGDDRSDWEAMMKINAENGLSIMPSDGQRLIRKVAQIILTKPGGGGAIREFAEMVLDARAIDETTLPFA